MAKNLTQKLSAPNIYFNLFIILIVSVSSISGCNLLSSIDPLTTDSQIFEAAVTKANEGDCANAAKLFKTIKKSY